MVSGLLNNSTEKSLENCFCRFRNGQEQSSRYQTLPNSSKFTTSSGPVSGPPGPGSNPLPRTTSGLSSAASFSVPSRSRPARTAPNRTPSSKSYNVNVKRENSLTSKLQDQSMGIHKLIFDRLNNNLEESSKSVEAKVRLLSAEEQMKLTKFRRFLSAANITGPTQFMSRIETVRRRQKREARRSTVDELGVPSSIQSR